MSNRTSDEDRFTRVQEVGDLLDRIARQDGSAVNELLPLVYDELRSYAGKLMAAERPDHTLQRTALVHEVYMKVARAGATFESRLHFMNAAAQAMRRILIDHAEAKHRLKRGGPDAMRVRLDDQTIGAFMADERHPNETGFEAIALNDALDRLAAIAPRQASVVMLRFFAGCSDEEAAELLDVSAKTVQRDWQAARIWLYDRLRADLTE